MSGIRTASDMLFETCEQNKTGRNLSANNDFRKNNNSDNWPTITIMIMAIIVGS